MVTQGLKAVSKVEKELEHMAGDSNQDPAEQTMKEARHLAETAAFSAAKAVDEWGKKALNKTKEITEEIVI